MVSLNILSEGRDLDKLRDKHIKVSGLSYNYAIYALENKVKAGLGKNHAFISVNLVKLYLECKKSGALSLGYKAFKKSVIEHLKAGGYKCIIGWFIVTIGVQLDSKKELDGLVLYRLDCIRNFLTWGALNIVLILSTFSLMQWVVGVGSVWYLVLECLYTLGFIELFYELSVFNYKYRIYNSFRKLK